ncbi:glycosyltransferase [Cellulomonas sp. PhB143]|uniref:glycosyltransferase n=1 Tax=Cellulomonas sp. PhB143 TaxID=2485186 RepID=UPI000F4A26CA|nr:glycosyltransferase [Cellulomonas sp. PhB143]ROS78578.1 GT2 family glycosyltransferase [Cellulomonas sp. PhB143]
MPQDTAADAATPFAPTTPRVVAVVVAFDREELLRAALDALADQTRPVDAVLVVDNASTDGTARVAAEHPSGPRLLSLSRNTGGAGGFAVGLAVALEQMGAELVWLMDDDTIPTPTALEVLLRARDQHVGDVALLGSRVVWHDGREHPMNTPRRRPGAHQATIVEAQGAGAIPVRSSSFVSMLVDAGAVRAHGLPVADYFIWNDDFEFSCRLLRRATGLHVAGSVVEHRTKVFGSTDVDPGERFYFEVRNKIWLLTRSGGLKPAERVLYTGSSLVRWARTFVGSADRGVLVRSGAKGLRDGVLRGPQRTADVLAGLGRASDDVRAVERAAGRA